MDIVKRIDEERQVLIADLVEFTSNFTCDGMPIPQQDVITRLKRLGFEIDEFQDESQNFQHLPDFCPNDKKMHPLTKNVVGTSAENSQKSLLLFAHMDSEPLDYYGNENPSAVWIESGRLYGHGIMDDKAGVMMMIHALELIYKTQGKLPGNIKVMSLLGKHGGSSGTLSALMRGHRADFGIYLHPAETGYGFQEIKNMSLGVLDVIISVYGESGKQHDDLDAGKSSNLMAAKMMVALEEWNQSRRQQYRFQEGAFQDLPNNVINIGKVAGGNSFGGVAKTTTLHCRLRFFKNETVDSIYAELDKFLKSKFLKEEYSLQKGSIRANPTVVDAKLPSVVALKNIITRFAPNIKFIEMYHGASDIRLPYLYGNCPTIGLGPLGYLPNAKSKQFEWLDIDSYIMGLKVLTSFILEYFQQEK